MATAPFLDCLCKLLTDDQSVYTDILVKENEGIRYLAPVGWVDLGVEIDMEEVIDFCLELSQLKTKEKLYEAVASEGALNISCTIQGQRARVDISLSTTNPTSQIVDDSTPIIQVGRSSLELTIRKGSVIPSLTDLEFPPSFIKALTKRSGLILITGQAGSGKTTTSAAILRHINETMQSHIICIGDPIEFFIENESSVFSYKELGKDAPSFELAVYNAYRQRADVICISELRDRETTKQALSVSYSALVIATIHSPTAEEGLERIINFFPSEEQMIYRTLQSSINFVVSQALLPTIDNQNFKMAFELISGTNEVLQSSLRAGKGFSSLRTVMHELTDIALKGQPRPADREKDFRGLLPMNVALVKSVLAKKVSAEHARRVSPDQKQFDNFVYPKQVKN